MLISKDGIPDRGRRSEDLGQPPGDDTEVTVKVRHPRRSTADHEPDDAQVPIAFDREQAWVMTAKPMASQTSNSRSSD